MPSFNAISRRYTIVSSRKNLNSASKVADWIIIDILNIFIKPYVITGRVIEIRLLKITSYLSLQYFTYSVSI